MLPPFPTTWLFDLRNPCLPHAVPAWLQDPTKWGGAIELSILSQHLRREVAAFDIQTTRVDIYGQGAGYSERVMVIYDGEWESGFADTCWRCCLLRCRSSSGWLSIQSPHLE
jgi:hypothetical protein